MSDESASVDHVLRTTRSVRTRLDLARPVSDESLFECISALGTVGLSTGITPLLSDPGKIVLIVLMLVGRLGPITAAVARARHEHVYQPEYPEEEPLIG
jgi:Trk-type K+ transport system membrane component